MSPSSTFAPQPPILGTKEDSKSPRMGDLGVAVSVAERGPVQDLKHF
ncbi:MAG: hypothetical protein HC852_14685 [Acaryochloridaceae cyanobacterium RU_4_10]|nr:hypothetical protein [Acaryochloridaceae cyanobacterium RU_4_10]